MENERVVYFFCEGCKRSHPCFYLPDTVDSLRAMTYTCFESRHPTPLAEVLKDVKAEPEDDLLYLLTEPFTGFRS